MSKAGKEGLLSEIRTMFRETQVAADASLVKTLDEIIRAGRPDVTDAEIPELRMIATEAPAVPWLVRRRWKKRIRRHEARQGQNTPKLKP